MVAALFVMADGPYAALPGVDPWPVDRDARRYAGPWPVVAHPPCERWGRYWSGGPSVKVRRSLGEDEGCFSSALASVRAWGGVLEHPEASHAWAAFGIIRPPKGGGWVSAGPCCGWTACVEQGHYGHPARKATWLYAYGMALSALPSLAWGPAPPGLRLDQGFHSAGERAAARDAGHARPHSRLNKFERTATPPLFVQILISIARSAERRPA